MLNGSFIQHKDDNTQRSLDSSIHKRRREKNKANISLK